MKIKFTLAAAILALTPGLALAMGCQDYHPTDQQAMSCADGLTYDEKTGTCVEIVTG